ncbi:MAG TPA: hypothetical protein DCE56_44175 [Cyanobacteria bacterium UBA8553]|nr:hypothetical protein [Cyanobacteria bacterium UBA8553]
MWGITTPITTVKVKGTFILPLPDDFDEPLEDFQEYMSVGRMKDKCANSLINNGVLNNED